MNTPDQRLIALGQKIINYRDDAGIKQDAFAKELGISRTNLIDDDVKVASCVINDKAVPLFDDKLYTVRVSTNSFVGSAVKTQKGNKGPDTTMRLFNQL